MMGFEASKWISTLHMNTLIIIMLKKIWKRSFY